MQELIEEPLSELEETILSMHSGLGKNYGITPGVVADKNNLHIEVAQLRMEDLEQKGHIALNFYTNNDESAYRLTSKGRRYVVDNNLLKFSG